MLTWCDNSLTSRAMQPRSCINSPVARLCCLWLGLVLAVAGHGASLQTFAVVYGQLTNDIAILEAEFDNSPEQKQTFATLVRARSVILNPELRDEQALAALVDLLEASGYDTTLDEAANNARASVLSAYDAVATRTEELPPSRKTTVARNRFDGLAAE